MPAWIAAASSDESGFVKSMPLTSPAKPGPTCRMERGMETLRRGTPCVCLDILPQEGGDENTRAAGAAPRAMPSRLGRNRIVQPWGALAVIACKVPVGAVARDELHPHPAPAPCVGRATWWPGPQLLAPGRRVDAGGLQRVPELRLPMLSVCQQTHDSRPDSKSDLLGHQPASAAHGRLRAACCRHSSNREVM